MTRLTKIAVSVALIAAVAASAIWLPVAEWLAASMRWIELHPHLAWPSFIAVYIAATVLALPGSILTLAAGFVFGLPLGVALTSVGSTLGACAAFAIGRYVAREWVAGHIAEHARFAALDRATRHEGLTIVFLARLSPLFPFNALNYFLPLTAVRFRDYALATWIGMLPATVLYVYIGAAAGDLRALLTGNVETGPAGKWLLFGGLLATVALTVAIARAARRALDRHLQTETDPQESRA